MRRRSGFGWIGLGSLGGTKDLIAVIEEMIERCPERRGQLAGAFDLDRLAHVRYVDLPMIVFRHDEEWVALGIDDQESSDHAKGVDELTFLLSECGVPDVACSWIGLVQRVEVEVGEVPDESQR